MLRSNSIVSCVDNTGVKFCKVFAIIGRQHRRNVCLLDRVWVVIVARNLNAKNMRTEKNRWRFRRGSCHRGLIISIKVAVKRKNSTYYWNNNNALVLTDRKVIPFGSKILWPVASEVIEKFPSIGTITYNVF